MYFRNTHIGVRVVCEPTRAVGTSRKRRKYNIIRYRPSIFEIPKSEASYVGTASRHVTQYIRTLYSCA